MRARQTNPNLLINPDFSINQRGVSGNFSETGKYFVDRWKLVSGSVTVNPDGSLTLNGVICQPLENAPGTDVTASSSAGTAVYDDSTGIFTVSGENVVLSWAKLERGNGKTLFSTPDISSELLKCQRFFSRISSARKVFGVGYAVNSSTSNIFISINQMRANPEISFTNLALMGYSHTTSGTSAPVSEITNIAVTPNGVSMQMVSSDLTSGQIYMPIVLNDGYIDFNAEI